MQQAEGTNPLGRGQNVRGNGTVFRVAVVISDMAPNMKDKATFHRKTVRCVWPIRMGRFWWTGVQLV
jgi:hypothetical protein